MRYCKAGTNKLVAISEKINPKFKMMKDKILNELNLANSLYHELIQNYKNVLPENIIAGSINNFEVEIPKFVNNFLSILNSVEGHEVFKPVKTIGNALEIFNEQAIDSSIEKTIENKNIVGIGGKTGTLSAKELLDASVDGIESGVRLLNMQLKLAKLSAGELQ